MFEFLLELFETANLRPHMSGAPRIELAQVERPNVDVALQWATGADPLAGLRLVELEEMYWFTNDPVGAREHLDALLAAAGARLDPAGHGRALRLRGASWEFVGRSDLAEADYREAMELLRSAGDDEEAAHLTLRIANTLIFQGDAESGRRMAAETLERGVGVPGDEAVALGILAHAAVTAGEPVEAWAPLAHDSARAAEEAGMVWWRAVTLGNTAEFLALGGELDLAEEDYAEGLRALWSVQDLMNMPNMLVTGALIAALRADPVRAGTLWGAVEAAEDRQPAPTGKEQFEPHLEAVRGKAFEEARQRGRTLTLEQAVAYALGDAP
jgi:tetratricopeptide (TPR) repeat protein